MIVEIHFTYTVKVIPPKARNESIRTVVEILPINIPVMEADGFPVAARLVASGAEKHPPEDLRWDGQRLYARSADRNNWGPAARSIAPEELSGRGVRLDGTPLHAAVHSLDKAVTPAEVVGRVTMSDREERIASVVQAASTMVVFDGIIWRECAPPFWKLSHGCLAAYWGWNPEKNPEIIWSADSMGDLERLADGRPLPRKEGSIEVLIVEAVRIAPEAAALHSACRTLLETVGKSASQLSVPQFILFADLRDAASAFVPGEGEERLESAARACIETWPGKQEFYAGRVETALKRIEMLRDRATENLPSLR